MPLGYKPFENPKDDKRRKLMPEQYGEIRRLYQEEGKPQNALARQYGVSRSLISIIVNPERAAKVQERIKKHWREYSDREKLTEATRKLRRRKVDLGLSFNYKKEMKDGK